MEPIENNTSLIHEETKGLLLLQDAQIYLREAGKWAKFLGILGYVLTAIILLAGVGVTFVGSSINTTSASVLPFGIGPFLGIMYIIAGIFYFVFSNYLYKFGKGAINGVEFQDAIQISVGLGKLKSLFKFWGILTIIMLAIYALALIGIVAGAAFMH